MTRRTSPFYFLHWVNKIFLHPIISKKHDHYYPLWLPIKVEMIRRNQVGPDGAQLDEFVAHVSASFNRMEYSPSELVRAKRQAKIYELSLFIPGQLVVVSIVFKMANDLVIIKLNTGTDTIKVVHKPCNGVTGHKSLYSHNDETLRGTVRENLTINQVYCAFRCNYCVFIIK